MKRKLVLWGTNAEDEKVLIGLELVASDKKVNIYTLKEEEVTEDLHNQLFQEWRDKKEIGFPSDKAVLIERELTVSDTILPDDLRTENTELVSRAQTEWHFVVLSTKLSETYHQEIDSLKERIERLEKFESNTWDELKNFWSKVQSQIREKNLFREHSQTLKDHTNELFGKMKGLRKTMDEEFKEVSKNNKQRFDSLLKEIEEKVGKGIRLDSLFGELKDIQKSFRETEFARRDRSEIWERLDGLFKTIKEKRFGKGEGKDSSNSPLDRILRRREGLVKAIDRMRNSIKKDESDLDYQKGKERGFAGQLEQQLKAAKLKMLEDRIASKKEKFEDMMKTKTSLDKKVTDLEEKQKLRSLKEQAKKEAEAKIQAEMAESVKEMEDKKDILEKAAKEISSSKSKKKKPKVQPDSKEESLGTVPAADFSADLQLALSDSEEE